MIELKELYDLKVVYKAFWALKFGVDDDRALELFRSPFFKDIFNKVSSELENKVREIPTIDNLEYDKEDSYIDNWPKERGIIINYLLQTDNWLKMDKPEKIELIETLVSPFYYDEKSIKRILAEVDELAAI
ncbi:hypothetical protein [Desertivirga xinjiangensis]|uniref:hypothetical protein n=1 Tax=Desertivirga xinjiangensis TaxID=539206 RepID=UPI00210C2EDC|nr:hypothetical protein [Pedobacter xinjiangensis]